MGKKGKLILIILLVVVGFGVVYLAYESLSRRYQDQFDQEYGAIPPKEEVNQVQPAPDFSVLNEEGNPVSLSNTLGKPVVLNFWASWCPPCREEMPHFEKLYQEMKGQVEFFMVDLTDGQRETVESAKDYILKNGFTFPIYFDTKMEGAITYSVNTIPMTVFIDREGNVKRVYDRAITEQALRREIEEILK